MCVYFASNNADNNRNSLCQICGQIKSIYKLIMNQTNKQFLGNISDYYSLQVYTFIVVQTAYKIYRQKLRNFFLLETTTIFKAQLLRQMLQNLQHKAVITKAFKQQILKLISYKKYSPGKYIRIYSINLQLLKHSCSR